MFQKICHCCKRRIVDNILIDQLKYRIDMIQPLRNCHVWIIYFYCVSDKCLEEVVVGVDKARIDKFVFGINDFISTIGGQILAYFYNFLSVN